MTKLFGELDYRMSVVERWSTVRTIRKQNLAEHSFNVAVIAGRIAEKWAEEFGQTGSMYDRMGNIYQRALSHDFDESITGDFPSYMKPYVDVQAALENVDAWEDAEPDLGDVREVERFFVKCADYIDACVFLRMEISLGNRSVTFHLRHLEQRFRNYISEAQSKLTEDASLVYTWYNEDVVEGLFGGNGQYVSEIDGFPKSP